MEKTTPNYFKIVKTPNEKYIIISGGALVSKKEFETKEDAQKYIDKKPWELIFGLILMVELNLQNGKINLQTK